MRQCGTPIFCLIFDIIKSNFFQNYNLLTNEFSLLNKEKIANPSKIERKKILKLKKEEILGISTKIEPKEKPIIEKKVLVWKFFNKKLVNFIKTRQPKISPSPIGIRIGKYILERELK